MSEKQKNSKVENIFAVMEWKKEGEEKRKIVFKVRKTYTSATGDTAAKQKKKTKLTSIKRGK